jgi:hypothetical protein
MKKMQHDYFKKKNLPEVEFRIKSQTFEELVRDIDRKILIVKEEVFRLNKKKGKKGRVGKGKGKKGRVKGESGKIKGNNEVVEKVKWRVGKGNRGRKVSGKGNVKGKKVVRKSRK